MKKLSVFCCAVLIMAAPFPTRADSISNRKSAQTLQDCLKAFAGKPETQQLCIQLMSAAVVQSAKNDALSDAVKSPPAPSTIIYQTTRPGPTKSECKFDYADRLICEYSY